MTSKVWLGISNVSASQLSADVTVKFCACVKSNKVLSVPRKVQELGSVEILVLQDLPSGSEVTLELFIDEYYCGKSSFCIDNLSETPTAIVFLTNESLNVCTCEITAIRPLIKTSNQSYENSYSSNISRVLLGFMEHWGYIFYLLVLFTFASSKLGLFPRGTRSDGLSVGKFELDGIVLTEGISLAKVVQMF